VRQQNPPSALPVTWVRQRSTPYDGLTPTGGEEARRTGLTVDDDGNLIVAKPAA
jgi:hypothetical protein